MIICDRAAYPPTTTANNSPPTHNCLRAQISPRICKSSCVWPAYGETAAQHPKQKPLVAAPGLSLHHFSKCISLIRINSSYHLHTCMRSTLFPVPLITIAGSRVRSPRCQFALGSPLQVARSICNVLQEIEMNSKSNWLHSGLLHDKNTNLCRGGGVGSCTILGIMHNTVHCLLLKPLKC